VGLAVVAARRGAGSGGGADVGAPAATAGRATTTSRAGGPTTVPATSGSAIPPAQKKVFDQLMAQVSDIRGLQWKGPLDLQVVSPDVLAQKVREANARDLDAEQLGAQAQTLKLLHLIPADTDLRKTLDDVLAGIVLGFYDPETKRLYVGGEDLDAATKYTIAHEMTHALTDQVFNFGPATDALDKAGKTEESAAYSALLEGDAVLTQELWAEKYLSEDEQVEAVFGGASGDPSVLAKTPGYIIQSLYFPYDEGLTFVKKLHDSGGYAAVDAAYRKPPTSTEQIIHPETYTSGQGWTAPALPDLAAATGCPTVITGTVGQFDMRAVLDERLSQSDASNAVAGWNGDAYGLVKCGSALGMAERWTTDPGTNPATFVNALDQWAGTWSGSGKAPGTDGRFSGPNGSGRISRTGSQVDIVLAQDSATSDRLVRALGG
jgi:hypothetical protein